MKKILVVTTSFPFPLYSGDKLRIYNIAKHLSKKNSVDLIYTGTKGNFKKKVKFTKNTIFIKVNKIKSFFSMLKFLFLIKPLQTGYFFSSEMREKINKICKNYDTIIFHLIRSSELIPINYKGKKILEMTDLVSSRYLQISKKLSFFNLLKYLYFLEYLLSKKYEKKIINLFNYSVLVSKEDKKIFNIPKKTKNKIKIIVNGTELKVKKYKFNIKNNNIIFIGNINYLPNKIACFDFIKNTMPALKERGLDINFKIIGRASKILKYRLKKFNNVEVYSNVKNTEKFCKGAICGLCNLNIAAGVQNKILEYMRVGIPTIASQKSFDSFSFKKNKEIMVYKNQNELVNNIIKLKLNKEISIKLSYNGRKKIKNNYAWNVALKHYDAII